MGKVCTGRFITVPPDSTPRICVPQPEILWLRLMFTPMAKAAFIQT